MLFKVVCCVVTTLIVFWRFSAVGLIRAVERWLEEPWLLAVGGVLLERDARYGYSAAQRSPVAWGNFECLRNFSVFVVAKGSMELREHVRHW